MAFMKRAVGYCVNESCEYHVKGSLFPSRGEKFSCPRCGRAGRVEHERGVIAGQSDIFNEVRVEYDFDPTAECYRSLVRVTDESILARHNVYTLQTPFVRSKAQALRIADVMLRQLNRYQGPIECEDPDRASDTVAIIRLRAHERDGSLVL